MILRAHFLVRERKSRRFVFCSSFIIHHSSFPAELVVLPHLRLHSLQVFLLFDRPYDAEPDEGRVRVPPDALRALRVLLAPVGVGGQARAAAHAPGFLVPGAEPWRVRSEEHTSELQSLAYLVCRLLLEKKKNT